MNSRIVADVSSLPDAAFGSRTLMWWGVMGFILIESTAFLLGGGAYFFLMNHTTPWPPHRVPPDLPIGTWFTALVLLSEIPNVMTGRMAHAHHLGMVRLGLVLMSIAGLVLVGLRLLEFGSLNVGWDDNAYGSIVWALLFIHAVHVITDVADTVVLTVFACTHELQTTHFSDVADNCMYWHFVAIAWVPIYALLYWVPRLLQ